MSEITCFKAYDIRGQLGTQLDENIAYRIARAFAQWRKPKSIVLGGDIRESTAGLKAALANGLRDEGVDVLDLGMVGTEEVYFATFHQGRIIHTETAPATSCTSRRAWKPQMPRRRC